MLYHKCDIYGNKSKKYKKLLVRPAVAAEAVAVPYRLVLLFTVVRQGVRTVMGSSRPVVQQQMPRRGVANSNNSRHRQLQTLLRHLRCRYVSCG